MPGLSIDFSEVEDSFGVAPEDLYNCIVEDCTMRESKSSEHPYLNFEMKIVDEEYEDRRIWIGASTSPGGLPTTKEILVALGAIEEDDTIDLEWADDVDMTPKEGPQVTNPEVIGLACQVQTVNSVWEGRERQDAWRSSVLSADEAPAAKPKGKAKGKAAKGKAKRKLR